MKSAEVQLLEAIEEMLAGEESAIAIPMSRMNQGIAQLVADNGKIITRLQGRILRSLDRPLANESNDLDLLSTRVLAGLQGWQDENHLLLTQLAAKTDLTKPGDSLEQALVAQVADAPELAYSATLLLAIRDLFPFANRLIIVLEEIRDRLPGAPVLVPGELPDNAKVAATAKLIDVGAYYDGPAAE